MSGAYTGAIALPEEAAQPESFRFTFANRVAWIYNVDDRTWTGFRVFQN